MRKHIKTDEYKMGFGLSSDKYQTLKSKQRAFLLGKVTEIIENSMYKMGNIKILMKKKKGYDERNRLNELQFQRDPFKDN